MFLSLNKRKFTRSKCSFAHAVWLNRWKRLLLLFYQKCSLYNLKTQKKKCFLSPLGISGTALNWFMSNLSDSSQSVILGACQSNSVFLKRGVPQGSVLDPLLFFIYMIRVGQIIRKYELGFLCYADDKHIYISTRWHQNMNEAQFSFQMGLQHPSTKQI